MSDEDLLDARGLREPRRRRVRRPVHRQHDGLRVRGDGDLADGLGDGPGRRTREGGRSRERGRRARRQGARGGPAAERDHHARVDRERDRRPSAPPAARRTGCSTCSRSRARRGWSWHIDDFERISRATPLLADLKPGGRFVATDLYRAGGVPRDPEAPRRRGRPARRRDHGHRPHDRRGGRGPPRRPPARRSSAADATRSSRRAASRSCAATSRPTAAVVKLAGTERLGQTGPARVFESEEDCFDAVKAGHPRRRRHRDPQRGPVRGPRDARDAPRHRRDRRRGPRRGGRAAHRRPLLRRDPRADGRARRPRGGQAAGRSPPFGRATRSRSTSSARRLDVDLSDEEIAERVAEYEPPKPHYSTGVMAKYARSVGSASEGAITS